MADVLSSLPWADFSTGGILALAIVLIIRGDLIPRRTHEAMVSDRDEWKTLALRQQEINAQLAGTAKISAGVLNALPVPTEEARDADSV